MKDLNLVLNGEPKAIPAPATLMDLLRHLELDPQMVVVELNREIIRRPRLGDMDLRDGDAIEVVHFVGGG